MKRLALIFLALAAPAIHGADDTLRGLAGADLAREIQKQYAPVRLTATPAASWWGDGSAVVAIVPDAWWYDSVPVDLYNRIATDLQFANARGDLPPAALAEATASGSGWRVGVALLEGYRYNAWEPAADRRGDLARRFMYMALMYPQPLWRSYGAMAMTDGGWPLLSKHWQQLMLDWAANDPIDERELLEGADIAAVQGNHNPFVAIPDLPDWLWGEKSGQGFIPAEETARTPLRGTYSRAATSAIDLYSPYIPDDARWCLDGKPVDTPSLAVATLSLGLHELKFTANGLSGRVVIEIVK